MDRQRILVVDDEAAMTRLVRRNLERTGRFEVREENHAKRALQAAEDFQPHLIFLDLLMPEMDGKQVAEEIRRSKTVGDVPIVFISALVPTGAFKTPDPLPAPFVPKPVRAEDLIEAIERYAGPPRPDLA